MHKSDFASGYLLQLVSFLCFPQVQIKATSQNNLDSKEDPHHPKGWCPLVGWSSWNMLL